MIADLDTVALNHLGRDHGRLKPNQIPSVFDGQDGVRTGHDILQIECTVEISLITAEQTAVALWILGDQHNHRSRERLACAPGDPFYIDATAYYRERN